MTTDTKILALIEKPQLTKADANYLAMWYKKQTTVNMVSCFCSNSQKEAVREAVKTYLNGSD